MQVGSHKQEQISDEDALYHDTRRHSCECWCFPCFVKGTGVFGLSELTDDNPDAEITPEMYARYLQIIDERGRPMTKAYREWTVLVRAARRAQHMTQQGLADAAGLCIATVKFIEVCKHISRPSTIAAVSKVLGIDEGKARAAMAAYRIADGYSQTLLEKHYERHHDCAKCAGTGEIPDTSDTLGGSRLCNGQPSPADHTVR